MTPEREYQLDAWLALSGQTPPPAGPVRLPMLSGSMAPAIPVGASLEIQVEPAGLCRVGDVVVFQAGDKLIAHRVLLSLKVGPQRWLLEKGDANPIGCWRRAKEARGRVIGVATGATAAGKDPADTNLARRNLRQHCKHWLLTLGGLRPKLSSENQHD